LRYSYEFSRHLSRDLEKIQKTGEKNNRQWPQLKKKLKMNLIKGCPNHIIPKYMKRNVIIVFQHIYDSYVGDSHSIYEAIA
jgi:type I restriction enzyme R subunit